jgi:hypothetical protein
MKYPVSYPGNVSEPKLKSGECTKSCAQVSMLLQLPLLAVLSFYICICIINWWDAYHCICSTRIDK